MRMRSTAFLMAALLAGCVPVGNAARNAPVTPVQSGSVPLSPEEAAQNFVSVVDQLEPVAEALCKKARPTANCDFLIVVDDRPQMAPNAFQTLDSDGRPVVGFTLALIADARNVDEIAFVVGHESAHHIAGHIPQTMETAETGAWLAGILATATGASAEQVRKAQQAGATLGARTYAKDFELEADALGAEISLQAGYDPLRGAAFFDRLPDPGDAFLGTHPRNSERQEVIRRVVERYRRNLVR